MTRLVPTWWRTWYAVLAALVLALGVVGAAPAAAEEPVNLPGPVHDPVDVLSPAEEEAAAEEIAGLREETGLQLFAVFVDRFTDGGQEVGGPTWAELTSAASGMGTGDLVLAVAVDQRQYAVGDVGSTLPPQTVETVQLQDIEPRLAEDDWAGAVSAAVDGFAREYAGGGTDGGGGVVVPDDEPVHQPTSGGLGSGLGTLFFAAPVLLVAGAGVISRRGKGRRRPSQGVPVPRSAQEVSLPDLQRQAAEALVSMDNAVRSAEEELAFAEAQFGAQRTQQFRGVLEQARASAKEAFSLRQQLDDDQKEPEDVERSMLARIIELTGTARRTLDEHTQEFATLRSLQDRAPQFLDELAGRLAETRERLPVADQEMRGLAARHPAQALSTVHEHRQIGRAHA